MWSNRYYFFTKHSSASFSIITLIFWLQINTFFQRSLQPSITILCCLLPAASCLWALAPLNINKRPEILYSFQTLSEPHSTWQSENIKEETESTYMSSLFAEVLWLINLWKRYQLYSSSRACWKTKRCCPFQQITFGEHLSIWLALGIPEQEFSWEPLFSFAFRQPEHSPGQHCQVIGFLRISLVHALRDILFSGRCP